VLIIKTLSKSMRKMHQTVAFQGITFRNFLGRGHAPLDPIPRTPFENPGSATVRTPYYKLSTSMHHYRWL